MRAHGVLGDEETLWRSRPCRGGGRGGAAPRARARVSACATDSGTIVLRRRPRAPGRAAAARRRRRAPPRPGRRRAGTRRSARAARSSAGSRPRRCGSRRAGCPRPRRRSGRRPRRSGPPRGACGSAVRPSISGIERSSRTRSGCSSPARAIASSPLARLADDVEAVLRQEAGERIPGQRMVVDDEDPLGHALRRDSADRAGDAATIAAKASSGGRCSSSACSAASLGAVPALSRRCGRPTSCPS